ncbi:MAG TPA: ATP-binding protein [Planctomycetota bacterium]|nr:ATP-binding protein [Planctomycetota bacterium]
MSASLEAGGAGKAGPRGPSSTAIPASPAEIGGVPRTGTTRHEEFALPPLARYCMAMYTVASAIALAALLRGIGDNFAMFAPFFVAIIVTFWFGGTRPGLLALLLSCAGADYCLIPPYYSFTIDASYIPSFVSFVVCAALAGWMSDARRRAERTLREARDTLEDRVNERTLELKRLNAKLEREIGEKQRVEGAMLEARGELARVTRATTVGELTASIAHEINNPLAAVVTNADASLRWLDREPPELDEAREAVRRIIDEGHRASQIVTRIRGLVKKLPPSRTLVDVNGLLGEIAALCRHEMSLKHVGLHFALTHPLPMVLGDKVQLQQVILNLVMNGLEAMDGIGDRPRKLTLGSRMEDTHEIEVTVADTGTGFDDAQAQRMFSAFYTTKPGGMGMGLSISRSIIEAHGGRLQALPQQPHGSVFQFFLPVGASQ